jgi:NAD(P)-dependent dehydrogenase (short-subunit alcohol dehydrogenase family)
VVVADINDAKGTKVADEIGRRGRPIFVHLDVTSEKSWKALIDTT